MTNASWQSRESGEDSPRHRGPDSENESFSTLLTGQSRECKKADTPGTKGTGARPRDGEHKLDESETAAFQSALGSVIHVAFDRPEILYATKTVASFMQSSDEVGDGQAQATGALSDLDVYGASEWAGDEERKRSTIGVAEIFGGHALDAASATQSLASLSSAEAEFYASTRGTEGGLQTCHFLIEACCEVIPLVWSDSSACRGTARRQGTGRLMQDPAHVDTGAAAER